MHAAAMMLVRLADDATTQPSAVSEIVGLVFIFGIVGLSIWVYLRVKSNRPVNDLRDRYARGEISQDEFEARMDDLRRPG